MHKGLLNGLGHGGSGWARDDPDGFRDDPDGFMNDVMMLRNIMLRNIITSSSSRNHGGHFRVLKYDPFLGHLSGGLLRALSSPGQTLIRNKCESPFLSGQSEQVLRANLTV